MTASSPKENILPARFSSDDVPFVWDLPPITRLAMAYSLRHFTRRAIPSTSPGSPTQKRKPKRQTDFVGESTNVVGRWLDFSGKTKKLLYPPVNIAPEQYQPAFWSL